MATLFPKGTSNTKYPGPVLGSDFPVEPPNPFHGMYAAVTRLNPVTGSSPAGEGGWYPEESLSVEQAVLGFTRNAGYGWFRERQTGAIEVGKWADWVVVDRNVFDDRSGKTLRDVVVAETWVGGKRVFQRVTGDETKEWVFQSIWHFWSTLKSWLGSLSREINRDEL
jgi:hypothetical protein